MARRILKLDQKLYDYHATNLICKTCGLVVESWATKWRAPDSPTGYVHTCATEYGDVVQIMRDHECNGGWMQEQMHNQGE